MDNTITVRFKALQVGQRFTYTLRNGTMSAEGYSTVTLRKMSTRTARRLTKKGVLTGDPIVMRDDAPCDIEKPKPTPQQFFLGEDDLKDAVADAQGGPPTGWCCVWVKHEELVRLQRAVEVLADHLPYEQSGKPSEINTVIDGWLADPARQIRQVPHG